MEKEDYLKVVGLFDNARYQEALDMLETMETGNDALVLEMIIDAQYNLNNFDAALENLESAITHLAQTSAIARLEFENKLTFFFRLKSEILRKKGNRIKEYNAIQQYEKMGGDDPDLIRYGQELRKLIVRKYLGVIRRILWISMSVYSGVTILLQISYGLPEIAVLTIVLLFCCLDLIKPRVTEDLFFKAISLLE